MLDTHGIGPSVHRSILRSIVRLAVHRSVLRSIVRLAVSLRSLQAVEALGATWEADGKMHVVSPKLGLKDFDSCGCQDAHPC